MDYFLFFSELEASNYVHLGRLLILFNIFSGTSGTSPVNGITKLAKLDFLLRYPLYLKKALEKRNGTKKSIEQINIKEYEKKSVESKMIRYRYGPWDFLYNQLINVLVAKGLIQLSKIGNMISFVLSLKGFEISKKNCK